jgi:hypothetical protein
LICYSFTFSTNAVGALVLVATFSLHSLSSVSSSSNSECGGGGIFLELFDLSVVQQCLGRRYH